MTHKPIGSIASTFVIMALCLASRAQASPIKLQPIAVTASKTYAGSSPNYATDGNSSTVWNAGAGPTQWIQLDLGRTVAIQKLRFLPAQTPNGYTIHSIDVGQDPINLKFLVSLPGNTYDGQWFEYACKRNRICGNIRYIRITTTQSPSWVAWKEIEVYQGVEYLGYYADAFDWVGNGDYIGETTASGTNIVWIAGSASNYAARLQEANAHGAKAVLVVSNQLFTGTTLRTDWQAQWASIAAIVRAAPANSVAAFYPADEPIGAGYSLADLTTVISRIRQDFPTVAIAVIFSPGDMYSPAGPSYAALYDWIGFDCYGDWAACNDQWYIDTLRTWQSVSQRLIVVPWAFRWQDQGTDVAGQNQVVNVISQWQKEIVSDPSYVAVFPFLWQSADVDANGRMAIGTRDLPLVKARMYEFTQSILHPSKTIYSVDSSASTSYPGMVPFLAFDGDATNMWNAGGGPTAWILADFGGSTRLNNITLTVAQSPAGQTTHTIEGLTLTGWTTLGVLKGSTQENKTLGWSGTAEISQVRVTTSQSPSWVAWHEIRFSRN